MPDSCCVAAVNARQFGADRAARSVPQGTIVACEKGHAWAYSEGLGWARVKSEASPVPAGFQKEELRWPHSDALSEPASGVPQTLKEIVAESAVAFAGAPPEPLHAVFNASPEARCVPKWLTGPIHHAFTPGALVCQCGQTETSDGNTARLRKEPADEHANAGQQGGQEPPRSAGLARGSGSPPRSADLARGGAGAPIGGAGELRPVPGVEDPAAERGGRAEPAAAAEAAPGGGEQAVPAGGSGAEVGAPPGYIAIPCEQLDRAAREAGCAWGVKADGEFYLVRLGLPFATTPEGHEMAQERAWAQQRLADAEVRAAARHAETVELLAEQVRLLGLLRDAAYFKAPAATRMGERPLPSVGEVFSDLATQRDIDGLVAQGLGYAHLLYQTVDMERLTADKLEELSRLAGKYGWVRMQLQPCCLDRIKAAQREEATGVTFGQGYQIACRNSHILIADRLAPRHWMLKEAAAVEITGPTERGDE